MYVFANALCWTCALGVRMIAGARLLEVREMCVVCRCIMYTSLGQYPSHIRLGNTHTLLTPLRGMHPNTPHPQSTAGPKGIQRALPAKHAVHVGAGQQAEGGCRARRDNHVGVSPPDIRSGRAWGPVAVRARPCVHCHAAVHGERVPAV